MSVGREDGGQALAVVALGFGVLLGALSLAADWGHGLAMRRVGQNQADAGALAAGKLLAASFTPSGFAVTQDDVWTYAACAAIENRGFDITRQTETVAVRFGSVALLDPTVVWTPFKMGMPPPPGRCPAVPTRSGIPVPADTGYVPANTRYVEVRAETTFTTLFGAVTRREVVAGASARARLSGVEALRTIQTTPVDAGTAGVGINGAGTGPVPIWPIARHYDRNDYVRPCGQYCDPEAAEGDRITLWSNGDPTGGRDRKVFETRTPASQFIGLLDPSHQSIRLPSLHQTITESDYSGTTHLSAPTVPVANRSATCPTATWDTNGGGGFGQSIACNIPNWLDYGYRGGFGLGTDWASSTWDTYLGGVAWRPTTQPSELPTTRMSCSASSTPFLSRPSCSGVNPNRVGDWIETYPLELTPTDLVNMSARMREYISREGRVLPWSTAPVRQGPNRGERYGKAAIVYIIVWDCAETFDDAITRTWSLIPGSSDCSLLTSGSTPRIDRVHTLSVAPFTFYEGLVTTKAVEAYWGGAFGDPGVCRPDGTGCRDLDPLKNTAFLVPAP